MKRWVMGFFFLAAALLIAPSLGGNTSKTGLAPGWSATGGQVEPDGFLAVAPKIFRSGATEKVAVSLIAGGSPARGDVRLALLRDEKEVAATSALVDGHGEMELAVPRVPNGDYRLRLSGAGFQADSSVRVEDATLLFVESDKPVYRPGQTVHLRLLTLDTDLKPVSSPSATVEVQDAKGLKLLRRSLATDEYGMATLDFPLSEEPNLGTWKVTATSGNRSAQIDIRVEKYVLPKYEVRLEMPRDWVLARDPIVGAVVARYSFGKPVKGDATLRALRYVGSWQQFAEITLPLDGRADFRLPAVGYVSGVPPAGGMGNVELEVTVREQGTGYEEKNSALLTVAASPVSLKLIPEAVSFKPGLPFSLLVIAESPDKRPVDADVSLETSFTRKDLSSTAETRKVAVRNGRALVRLLPPSDGISLGISARSGESFTSATVQSSFSPTGSFVQVEQIEKGTLKVGDTARFRVNSTGWGHGFFYEVLARGRVVFSAASDSPEIELTVTPEMAPTARLLVYQLQPSSEVAADYLPIAVQGAYPQQLQLVVDREEARPGEQISVAVRGDGKSRIGLAAVDRSVFILAENRVNLQQLFQELERLYQKPQAELHEVRPIEKVVARGAWNVFADAGVVVLSNKSVPNDAEYPLPAGKLGGFPAVGPAAGREVAPMAVPSLAAASPLSQDSSMAGGLVEVQRVRQLFPETWLWDSFDTDAAGNATRSYQVPDSITTWELRAVALSKTAGLGVAEAKLRVAQPLFISVDLPYSVVRGERFPVKVALYNYQDVPQELLVELEAADWFELLDQPTNRVVVGPNSVGSASFNIRPRALGTNRVKVTARSTSSADAVVKQLLVEPEGVSRESVQNLVLPGGARRQIDVSIPRGTVEGSARAYLAVSGSYLTQSVQGLERLLQMPFGCGEQNMILFAPNVFVSRYLRESGQMKPEIMARAQQLMITGYQRELTYRRSDGSFSAFGSQDTMGSLWLTAFVTRSFAQAKGLIFVDDAVLSTAARWMASQQKSDGSFDPVGFVHHQELLGGLKGRTALTAYVALALREAGNEDGFHRAVRYLERAVGTTDDAYSLALAGYVLGQAKSPGAAAVRERLLSLAKESDDGLYWGEPVKVQPARVVAPRDGIAVPPMPPAPGRTASIETTGYAVLALLEQGDRLNAARAARWLAAQRGSLGGFGSTQDTVVGLEALTRFAAGEKSAVDAVLIISAGGLKREIQGLPETADLLQMVEIPVSETAPGAEAFLPVALEVRGKGQVVVQSVLRYNVPSLPQREEAAFQIEVEYGAGQIEVDDQIDVHTRVRFAPPVPMMAGMVVVDVAVPTGFTPVVETLDALIKAQPRVKRYDLAGRKVIIYLDEMAPGEEVRLSFKARALYPVKAQPVASQVYSYYRPEWRGESLGGVLEVR